jgi:hypothetical protein
MLWAALQYGSRTMKSRRRRSTSTSCGIRARGGRSAATTGVRGFRRVLALVSASPRAAHRARTESASSSQIVFLEPPQLGHLAQRKIRGMWIIRHGDEGDDILRTHGLVPAEISERFNAARHRHD